MQRAGADLPAPLRNRSQYAISDMFPQHLSPSQVQLKRPITPHSPAFPMQALPGPDGFYPIAIPGRTVGL